MTVNALHEAIIERLEEELNRMACFADKRIRGYSHDIPILDYQEDEEDAVFPYFKVRTTDVDIKEEDSRTETYILVGIRESDRSMAGYFVLFSVLEKIEMSLRRNCIAGPFWCEREMKLVIEEDEDFSYPYFFGCLKTNWNIPEIAEEEVTEFANKG